MARSSSRPVRRYASKTDLWLSLILLLSMCVALAGGIAAGMQEGWLRAAQVSFVMLGVIGLIVWIRFSTHYTFEGRDLIVRSGPLRWTIPVDEITNIEQATGLMMARSSPALSLDRLRITYRSGKTLMISPADKAKFLADLKARQKPEAGLHDQ
ncbi:MAG: PH domain-containing protein [Hyphomonadaceae bacterium]